MRSKKKIIIVHTILYGKNDPIISEIYSLGNNSTPKWSKDHSNAKLYIIEKKY